MAKKALLDVLEQTIGKYVKNLDAESLNVAVWSGKIELHSLELDVESVNQELDKRAEDAPNLAVPFRVLSGRFESLEVVVPWAQITSRPVVLRARGLSIEVEPFDRSAQLDQLQTVDADDIATTASLRERREQLLETSNKYRLQAFAMKKIALSEADSESDPNSNAKSSFSSRLVRRIIENIQIEIEDVHVSLTDSDGSAGVVLGSLKLATTDKNGNQVFVDRTKDVGYSRDSSATFDMSFLYKVLQIEGLGVYLDEDQFMNAKSLLTISETGDDDDASSQNPTTLAHSFVLAPLSFEATLRQADSNDCVDYAKYMLRSQLSSLSVMLTRSQLDIARKISKAIDSPRRGPTPLFPAYRPLTKVRRGTAKDWWKYAVRCIGRLNGKRSWVEFILAHRKRKAYIPLFKRQAHYMTCSWLKPLSAEEMDVLIEIEHDRSISVEGLMAWRNIADAQIDKEREKYDDINKSKTKQSSTMYSYLFGSSSKGNSTSTPNNSELNTKEGEADDPPISLSPEEMRKLEGMEQAGFTENELSKESKLCDIEFVLAALKVDLVGYDLRLIASLAMGQVSVTFDAAMDGAYGFNFALSDLEIFDRCTPQSLFPSVLRTIDKREEKQSDAVLFNVTKSSSGDQGLSLKVSAFEAVASQLLVRELRRFLRETPLRSGKRANPLLAQSISGSVDLFYDADEGGSFQQEPSPAQNDLKPKPSAIFNRYDLSNALIDAWKEKTAAKVSWMLDLDVVAPVILVPETCNDPRANVLVFDLGNLKVNYGKYNPTFQVQQWFDQHPRETLNEETYDSGNIAINDLTFSVQKASLWQSLPSNKAQSIFRDAAVIQPTGVLIDFAIESIGSEGAPRFCSIGVIPTISLKLSPSQVSQILPVVNSWQDVVSDGDGSPVEAADRLLDSTSNEMPNGFAERFYVAPSSTLSPFAVEIESQTKSVPLAYCSIGLQRLSLVVADDKNNRLEAHLVSVYGSILQSSDGGSVSILRMGWFWILDWMTYDFPRRQRLLVHSTLPLPAQHFSDCEEYNILEELTKQGVFERDYSGSTALADVSYTTFSHDQVAVPEALVHEGGGLDARISIPSLLDVKFHSLLIHWNPQAIKEVTSLLSRFTAVGDDDDKGTVILSPSVAGTSERPGRVPSQPKHESSNRMLISARMESLDIVLNSARDDLPLFALTVSKARFSLKPLGSGQEIALSLGDLRVATPGKIGRTLPDYRTLLGLAPGTSESLLTINYYLGRDAVKTVGTPETEKYENLEALAHVEFSPMRFCYLHSQVMTLVEYITEGMLGAITAKAATSAAEAAKELANSVSGGSLFVVRATALDFLVPRAATSQELLTIRTTSLDVEYCMLPESGGSNARISLSDLFVADTCDEMLQEAPVQMQVTVRLPAFGIGTLVDQAMHVNVEISKASFVLTKDQYEQLMNTFDDNIGATDLFLRDDISSEVSTNAAEGTKPGDLTHAGVQFVERARRLYFVLGIKELSLKLQGSSSSDPLVRLAGVDARVSMKLFPDQRKSSTEVLLQNLVCEDCRLVALNRQYRYLIEQSTQTNEGEINSIFQIGYTTEESKSDIDVLVGSPQVVLIPDVISEVLAFVSSRKSKAKEVVDSTDGGDRNASILNQQIVEGDSREDLEEIETNRRTSNTTLSNFSAKTGTCRIVLVDLGSQLTIDKEAIGGSGGSSPGPQLTETIVLQGTFAANSSTESDEGTGKKLHSEFQFHADSMEMFTAFGREMKSPLQILEPAEASVHGSSRTIESGETTIEVRAAALTTMDFSLSMHNAALLIAILNSLEESFRAAEELSARKATEGPLSPKEQERIEHLASALEKIRADESIAYSESGSSLGDIDASSTFGLTATTASSTKYQLKVTMPETRITVVNDLQGMDEALFRVSVTNFVAGGEVLSPNFLFDFHCNTSILADYFDSSVNLWSRLLTKPWEITMKGSRAPSRRFKSDRLSSTLDLESFPCWVAFSEQFLVSLASAAQMWSIYTAAARGPSIGSFKQSSMTTTAARNLITSFPHAIANHCGLDVSFTLRSGSIKDRSCPNGHTQYFRFDPPTGRGYGGRRTYGQDVEAKKMIAIDVMGSVLVVNMDTELGHDRFPHELGDNLIIFTRAVKEGKTTVSVQDCLWATTVWLRLTRLPSIFLEVLHLTSHIEVINRTLIPFEIAVVGSEGDHEIGACRATNQAEITTSQSSGDGVDSKRTKSFSVPAPLLTDFATCWRKFGQAKLTLKITPLLSEVDANCISAINLSGSIDMVASLQQLKRSHGGHVTSKIDVQCCSKDQLGRNVHPFALQVVLKIRLIEDEHVCIDVYLEPRAVIENKIPLAIKIRTPMPQIFSTSQKEEGEHMEVTYDLDTNGRVEVFTPGPSIAISVRTRDKPIAGSELGWLDGGWVDLPLVPEFSLVDPIVGVLPFENSRKLSFDGARRAQGAEIFVVEGFQALGNLSEMVSAPKQKENSDKALSFPVSKQGIEGPLSFFLTVCNYGVDHTGDLLFEKATSLSTTGSSMRMASVWQSGRAFGDTSFDRKSTTSFREDIGESLMQDISRGRESKSMIPQPFGAFSSSLHRRRISLLSNAQSPIRLLQMTIEGDEGLRRTMVGLKRDFIRCCFVASPFTFYRFAHELCLSVISY